MPEPIPVTLRKGFTWSIEEMPAEAVSILLLHLLNHDFTVNDQELFPILGIDMGTRRKTANMPNVENGKVKQYRIINKALAMELLSSLLLTHLNSAERVTSWCLTNPNGLPQYFAPSGESDIEVSYPAAGETPAFQMIAEVSAKRQVDEEFYATQLYQAWRHADSLAQKTDNVTVYALVINGGKIGSEEKLQEVYRRIMERDEVKQSERVRVVPIFASDVAVALRDLDANLPAHRFRYGSDSLAEIFDKLQLGVLERKENDDEQWMRKVWLDTVEGQPTLDI